MTVIIDFPDGTDQVMSNWYYRQIKEDIRKTAPDDDALNFAVEHGGAMHLLSLDEASREMQDKIMRAMRFVAEQTLAGEIPGWQQPWPEDDDGTFTRVHLKVVTALLGNVNFFPIQTAISSNGFSITRSHASCVRSDGPGLSSCCQDGSSGGFPSGDRVSTKKKGRIDDPALSCF